MHPDFPDLRLSTAPVFEFYTINSDTLIEAGKHSGLYEAEFQCIIQCTDGRVCGCKRSIKET